MKREYRHVVSERLQEEYYHYRHESGLDVYVIPKDFSSSYAIYATKYGSVEQTFRKNSDEDFVTVPDGVAHFLEHKMFEEPDGSDAFRNGGLEDVYRRYLGIKELERQEAFPLLETYLERADLDPNDDADFLTLLLGMASVSAYLKSCVQVLLKARYPDLDEAKTREEQARREEAKRQKAEKKAESAKKKADKEKADKEKTDKERAEEENA